MDPFESASSSGEWWKEADLPDFSSEEDDKPPQQLPPVTLLPQDSSLPLGPLPRLPEFAQGLQQDATANNRAKTKHIKVSAKELHLRGKLKSLPTGDTALPQMSSMCDLMEEMFPYPSSPSYSHVDSEPDSVASTARSFGLSSASETSSPVPHSWLFKSVRERDECVQSIVSCLEEGDLELCTIQEKRRILEELKLRLKTIEGGVEALKASLKKIIKYKLCGSAVARDPYSSRCGRV